MALVAGQRSTLNPNAPLFIPAVYRQVEDFSPEWWDLVKTSTWFRDYWLSEHSEGSFDGDCDDDNDFVDLEDQLEELIKLTEDEEKKKPLDGVKLDLQGIVKELMIPKSGKERRLKSPAKAAKYQVKAAYCESPKSAPRRIHQIHQPR